MTDNSYKNELIQRLNNVIQGTCNVVGCDNCDLKWNGGCSASDLQEKLMDIEIEEMREE